MIRLALLVSLLAPALAGAELRVVLHDQVRVDRAVATLADVADLEGPEDLVESVASTTVRRLLGLGRYRVDERFLRGLLRPHLEGHELVVEGECDLAREARVFSLEMMIACAREELQRRADSRELEVRVARSAQPMTVPADGSDPARLVAEPLAATWWGEVPYRVKVVRGERELSRSLLILEVRAFRTMPVAVRTIAHAQALSLQDLRLERVQISHAGQDADVALEEVVGWEAQNTIVAGTPITPIVARPRPDVAGGTTVVLVYESGHFRITGRGTALSAGRVGEMVRVRTPSGRTVRGPVSASGEVTVTH